MCLSVLVGVSTPGTRVVLDAAAEEEDHGFDFAAADSNEYVLPRHLRATTVTVVTVTMAVTKSLWPRLDSSAAVAPLLRVGQRREGVRDCLWLHHPGITPARIRHKCTTAFPRAP